MHCRQAPPLRNDKPLPRQHSLAVLTPVTMFPPQPVASWHDWISAEPMGKHKLAIGHILYHIELVNLLPAIPLHNLFFNVYKYNIVVSSCTHSVFPIDVLLF